MFLDAFDFEIIPSNFDGDNDDTVYTRFIHFLPNISS